MTIKDLIGMMGSTTRVQIFTRDQGLAADPYLIGKAKTLYNDCNWKVLGHEIDPRITSVHVIPPHNTIRIETDFTGGSEDE